MTTNERDKKRKATHADRPRTLDEQHEGRLRAATGHAASSNHPELTPAHLLDALLQQQETMTRPLLTQVGVDPDVLAGKVHEQLSRLPRAEGGAEPGPLP